MKKLLVILIACFYQYFCFSQKIHLQTGLNYSRLNMDYVSFNGNSIYLSFVERDLFAIPYLGNTVSASIELGKTDANLSFLALVQYNQIGGKMGLDEYSRNKQLNNELTNQFTINDLSFLTLLKYKPIKSEKYNVNLQFGPKLDYTLSYSSMSNIHPTYIDFNKFLSENTNKLRLGLTIGIGGEYSITKKIGLSGNIYYNQHISNFSNRNVHESPGGKSIIATIDYLQFLFGVSYNLNN